jgi:hypothetical protein
VELELTAVEMGCHNTGSVTAAAPEVDESFLEDFRPIKEQIRSVLAEFKPLYHFGSMRRQGEGLRECRRQYEITNAALKLQDINGVDYSH